MSHSHLGPSSGRWVSRFGKRWVSQNEHGKRWVSQYERENGGCPIRAPSHSGTIRASGELEKRPMPHQSRSGGRWMSRTGDGCLGLIKDGCPDCRPDCRLDPCWAKGGCPRLGQSAKDGCPGMSSGERWVSRSKSSRSKSWRKVGVPFKKRAPSSLLETRSK